MTRLFTALMIALLLSSCAETEEAVDASAVAVYPGKADNYISPTSREYRVWGMGNIELAAEEWASRSTEERQAHVNQIMGYQFKAYSFYVNEYITDKGSHDSNTNYGGFAGLVKSSSLDWVLEPVDDAGLVWAYIWEIEVGGPRDLMKNLPTTTDEQGNVTMKITMPVLTDSQLEFSNFPSSFDPATYSGELTDFEAMIEAEDESVDAFPRYNELFDDGKLDIMIVVGGDYNESRWDLKAAEEIFSWLKDAGYKHSASKYSDLTLTSPPFTKTIKANGKDVEVEITLFHPAIVPQDQLATLGDAIIAGYETVDVAIYDGHAGQDPDYSGVVYHYNPRHAVKANDFKALNLPKKYQIFVFNGCKTYNAYPDAIYQNEAKNYENLDIISTVNFSWLSQQTFTTSGFISQLLAKRSGTHDPRTYVEILTDINRYSNHNVYYGVHGIDDNPQANPYADVSTLCSRCNSDGQCPGQGNLCVQYAWGRACGIECTGDSGCPADYFCGEIAVGSSIKGRQCMPRSFSCGN